MNKLLKIIIAILICQSAGLIGSVFTSSAIPNWYATLQKPVFSPPNWLFGPVWITLYTMMGISAYLIWEMGINKSKIKTAITWFSIQLFFNALWSIVFFGLQNIFAALVIIALLWLSIVIVIYKFWNIKKIAAFLLLPYIVWVSFASILNYYIWILNR